MSQDSSEEKSLPASAKKLAEARKKGQVAHSKEMVTAAVTLASLICLTACLPTMLASLRDGMAAVPEAYAMPLAQGSRFLATRIGKDMLIVLLPLIATTVAVVVMVNIILHKGVLFSLDPVKPKPERINPAEGFKRLFALKSLAELLKSLFKLLAVGLLTLLLLYGSMQALAESPACGLGCIPPLLGALLERQLVIMCLLMLAVGVLDIGLQRWLFLRDMRMTQTEKKRENKDMHGNPLIRRQHSLGRREGVVRRGMRHATFVIGAADATLALRYASPDTLVPVLVARALGPQAAAMQEEARRQGLPVVFDPAAVEVLAGRLRLGHPIPTDTFQTVIACMREASLL
jgi:type III secretion protein U